EKERLKSTWVNPKIVSRETLEEALGQGIEREYSFYDLLRRPEVNYQKLALIKDQEGKSFFSTQGIPEKVVDQVEIEVKYEGYVQRQQKEVERQAALDSIRIPENCNFARIPGLSNEVVEKLDNIQIGRASCRDRGEKQD